MFSLDPLTVGGGILLWKLFQKSTGPGFGAMTPQREEIYKNALEHLQDPAKLKSLAEAFEREGLKAQGAVLRRRADWRSRDENTKKKHEEIFQKALKSKNVAAILEVALAFESMTATLKAKQLRDYADSLKAASATVIDTTAEPAEKPAEKPADKAEEFKPLTAS
jgi:hypothetical protein